MKPAATQPDSAPHLFATQHSSFSPPRLCTPLLTSRLRPIWQVGLSLLPEDGGERPLALFWYRGRGQTVLDHEQTYLSFARIDAVIMHDLLQQMSIVTSRARARQVPTIGNSSCDWRSTSISPE